MRTSVLWSVLFLSCTSTAQAQQATTTVLGPFTGPGAVKHPENASLRYFGTDLGFAYAHGANIQFMFGDTWATASGEPIQSSTNGAFDDAMGSVPASADPTTWTSAATVPLIKIGQIGDEAKAFNPGGHPLEFFKTPVGGFSNGAREFGIFYTSKPVGCTSSSACGALTCDTGLGFFGEPYTNPAGVTGACVDGTLFCANETIWPFASGFCRDATSTIYRAPSPAPLTPTGRIMATALRHRIGMRSTTDDRNYGSIKEWLTNKFSNVAVATVQNFQTTTTAGRDYNVAGSTGAYRRVFLWGRPGFIGVRNKGRTLGLYFAYVDMPSGSTFNTWTVNYYRGGTSPWTTSESEATPLELGTAPPLRSFDEPHDIVNQMSVVWLQGLGKWVMFYGGGSTNLPTFPFVQCGVVEYFLGPDECHDVDMGNGSIRMRTATNPWGPWSAPVDVLGPADPNATPLSPHHGPGGMLRHPDCAGPTCAPHTGSLQFGNADQYGFWYGASIVAPWVRNGSTGGVDVTWLASTWDPYRVVMLKTNIR